MHCCWFKVGRKVRQEVRALNSHVMISDFAFRGQQAKIQSWMWPTYVLLIRLTARLDFGATALARAT